MNIDLTPEDRRELRKLVREAIDADKFKLSPRVEALRRILNMLEPPSGAGRKAPPEKSRAPASELELMLRVSAAGEEAAAPARKPRAGTRRSRPI